MRTSREIVKSTGLLSLITIFSLGFGFLKEMIIAHHFGAGEQVDAFLVASIVPLSVPRIITLAISLCFIPAYIEARQKDSRGAQNLLNFVLIGMLLFFSLCAVFFWWQAPGTIARLAPGFDAQALSLTTRLLHVLLPILFLFGLFRLNASLLNAHRSFAAPGLAVLLAPLAVIVAITALPGQPGVMRWGVALTIGHGLQAAFLLILLFRQGLRPGLRTNLKDPVIKGFLCRALPLILATSINLLVLVIDRAMASKLLPGSISALSYADKIFQVPLQAFILSIVTVMLPYASVEFLHRDKGDFKKTVQLSILMAAFVLLPVTAILVVMARPVVTVLLQRGAFDMEDTLVTSRALVGFTSGYFTMAIYYIFQRILIVMRKTPLLIVIAAANIALKVLLNLLFIKIFDAPGIAVASTLMFAITALCMAVIVYRLLGGLDMRRMIRTIVKISLAALTMAGGCLLSFGLLHNLTGDAGLGGQIAQIGLVSIAGLALYALMVWLFRVPEAQKLYRLLIRSMPLGQRS